MNHAWEMTLCLQPTYGPGGPACHAAWPGVGARSPRYCVYKFLANPDSWFSASASLGAAHPRLILPEPGEAFHPSPSNWWSFSLGIQRLLQAGAAVTVLRRFLLPAPPCHCSNGRQIQLCSCYFAIPGLTFISHCELAESSPHLPVPELLFLSAETSSGIAVVPCLFNAKGRLPRILASSILLRGRVERSSYRTSSAVADLSTSSESVELVLAAVELSPATPTS
jgi:hypothetical protein